LSMLIVRFFYTMSKTSVALFVNVFVLIMFWIIFKLLNIFVTSWSIFDTIKNSGFFTEGASGLAILVLAYILAFFFGGIFAILMFKRYAKGIHLFKGLKLFKKTSGVFIAIMASRIVYQYVAIPGVNSLGVSFYNMVIAILIVLPFLLF